MKIKNPINYRIIDQTGGGATEDIYAESLDAAIEAGREWIEDGDWSSEDGTYRTIKLECCVKEIVRAAWYVDIYVSGGSRDLRGPMTEDEARALCDGVEVSVEPYDGIVEQIKTGGAQTVDLVEAWATSEDSEDYRAIYVARGQEVDGEIDEDATREEFGHDCSGTFSDDLPECQSDAPGTGDDYGHEWVSPFSLVGGIRDNPGVWSNGGTRYTFKRVCRCCGMYQTEVDPGCQRNPGEALCTITLEDRDEASETWLKETHEEEGWLPQWLCELLDCAPTVRMTEDQAREWVDAIEEGEDADADEMEHAFAAIMGRRAEDTDREQGLLSLMAE